MALNIKPKVNQSGCQILSKPRKCYVTLFQYTKEKVKTQFASAYGAGLQPPLSEKNSIIREKLMYRSGKDKVR